MNYYAHGVRWIDRPWYAAGTAVPDWLSVVDRQVRVRTKGTRRYLEIATGEPAELARGILQHLDDDDWFHRSPAFVIVSERLTRAFRTALPDDEGFRPHFLGHIVTEIVLDGVLIARDPDRLERYYALFDQVDPALIEATVGEIAGKPATGLAWFVTAFRHERFLSDYGDARRLLRRLNQVMQRVKLMPLPDHVQGVLESAWPLVEAEVPRLLAGFPPESLDLLAPPPDGASPR
ncbi:MAG: hypothetical protein ACK50P_05915 [Planctomycetaceae bacterium]|jgi:hypothetical protein